MSLMPERTFESRWKLLEAAKDRIAVADTLPGLIAVSYTHLTLPTIYSV